MRGHIRKRGKNSWAIVVNLGRDPLTGKRHQHWQTVQGTKKDAERLLANTMHNLNQGLLIRPTRITVAEFLKQWLRDYVATNTGPRTEERYSQIIHLHLIPNLGRIPLAQLRPDHIQSYYAKALSQGRWDGRGALSTQTVLHHHRVLSEALNHAVKWGLAVRNIAQAVDPPRPVKKEMMTLAPEHIPTLFEEAYRLELSSGLPYYKLFLTAFHTGMRRGEILGLQWRDIDLDQATISVNRSLQGLKDGSLVFIEPKTQKARRLIAMTPSLALEMHQYKTEQEKQRSTIGVPLTEDSLVFSNPDGTPLNPNTISPAFSKIAKRAGLKLRLHDLRHSHATLMLKAGVHPKIVSERLGHATVALTLDTYSHVLPGLQEAAAKAFDENLGQYPIHKHPIQIETREKFLQPVH